MLPRTARKLSTIPAIPQSSRLLAPITTSLTHTHIHTKKAQLKLKNNNKATHSSRLFTAIPLPSLPSLPSLAQSFGIFTGNINAIASLTNTKNDRVMQRVWEKRKQRLLRATTGILDKFTTQNMSFETAEIYIRKAGSFDDSEDNGQREVHIALRGIAHTVVVLKCGDESYLLDRVVEGIRLTELQINDESLKIEKCNKFKPEEMMKLSTFNNINLSSVCIADWINKESQKQYNVITNSCVQFSFYFYLQFLSGLKAKQFIH